MLAPISSLVFGTVWPPFFRLISKVGDIAVSTEHERFCNLDAACIGQRKVDLLFLPRREDNVVVLSRNDLIIAVVDNTVYGLIVGQIAETALRADFRAKPR